MGWLWSRSRGLRCIDGLEAWDERQQLCRMGVSVGKKRERCKHTHSLVPHPRQKMLHAARFIQERGLTNVGEKRLERRPAHLQRANLSCEERRRLKRLERGDEVGEVHLFQINRSAPIGTIFGKRKRDFFRPWERGNFEFYM
ncbi:hypothetical protein R3P38DRAFT_2796685 [Favolaschia claudopus]|uniref:Uncharacterized protein n=1 Tax=Favolaschia claudopus TaxID=2862362 RepID=A0AAW0A502_9AGAR